MRMYTYAQREEGVSKRSMDISKATISWKSPLQQRRWLISTAWCSTLLGMQKSPDSQMEFIAPQPWSRKIFSFVCVFERGILSLLLSGVLHFRGNNFTRWTNKLRLFSFEVIFLWLLLLRAHDLLALSTRFWNKCGLHLHMMYMNNGLKIISRIW